MRNKWILIGWFSSLLTATVIAETKLDCEQTVTGDKGNAVCAGGDVTINNGLSKKQYEKMLKEQEERIVQRLQTVTASPENKKKQQLLEIELKAIQEKLANVEAS